MKNNKLSNFKITFLVLLIVFFSHLSKADVQYPNLFPDSSDWQNCMNRFISSYPGYKIGLNGKIDVDPNYQNAYILFSVGIVIYYDTPPVAPTYLGAICQVMFPKTSAPTIITKNPAKKSAEKDAIACGSEINYKEKILIESIPIEGTDFSLNYSSKYNPNNLKNRTLDLDYQLFEDTSTAMRAFINPRNATDLIPINFSTFDPKIINIKYINYTDLGLTYSDAFKNIYEFDVLLQRRLTNITVCRSSGAGISCTPDPEFYVSIINEPKTILTYKANVFGLKGWTLSQHHYFDKSTKMLFHGSGNVIPYDQFKTISLSPYGNVDLVINKFNSNEVFIFDQQGKHLETRDLIFNQLIYKFNYLANNNIDSIENRYGQKMQFFYNSASNIEKITSFYGVSTNIASDETKLSKVIDTLGNSYEMNYDSNNLLTSFKGADGLITTFTYSNNGDLLKEEKNNGLFQSFSDSIVNSLKSYIHSLNYGTSETVVTQISNNQKVTQKFNDQNQLSYQKEEHFVLPYERTIAQEINTQKVYQSDTAWGTDFDDSYQLTNQITTPNQSINYIQLSQDQRTYQNTNNPFSLQSVSYVNQEIGIDKTTRGNLSLGQSPVLTLSNEFSQITKVYYNSQGQPISIEPFDKYPTSIEYDSLGRTSKITKGTQYQAFTYDQFGYLNSATEVNGAKTRETKFLRNAKGQLLEMTLPNGDKVAYEYTPTGDVKKVITPNNQVHQFQLGLGDYLEQMITPSQKKTLISYDADKRISQVQKASGKVLNYVYPQGQANLQKIITPEGELSFNNYDSLSRVKSVKSTDNIQLDLEWIESSPSKQTWYDSDGSLLGSISYNYYTNQLRVKDILINGSKVAAYFYDKGRISSIQTELMSNYLYPKVSYESNIQAQVGNSSYNYRLIDSQNGQNPTEIFTSIVKDNSGSQLLINLSRIYDNFGQATEFTSSVYSTSKGVYNNYFSLIPTYDENNRLIKIAKNRKTYFNGNEIKSVDFYNQYLYPANSNNNMKEFTQYQDPNNPPIKKTTNTHNIDDQLLEMKGSINRKYSFSDDGEMSQMSNCFGNTSYEYDSFSNLKKITFPDGKVVEYKVDGLNRRVKKLVNGQVKEYYLWYDDHRLAAILDENKNPKLVYLFGPESSHAPSYLIKDQKTYKIIHDPGTGSVRYVVDPVNTYILQELEYDEYGNIMRNSNPSFQPILFAGGLHDQDSKFLRFGARDYDSSINRFTTRDPIGLAGGLNGYDYVNGNPLSYIDPKGLLADGLINAGEEYAEESALYWAQVSINPSSGITERVFANIAGTIASLWTRETSDKTAITLASSYVIRVIGPFKQSNVPKVIQRVRKYLRIDPPHHGKGWELDGTIPKAIKKSCDWGMKK